MIELELSDGTRVEIKAPGIGFAIEAEGGIPDLPGFQAACSGRDEAELERRRAEVLLYGALLIEHGTVNPRFRRTPAGPGERALGDLIEPDYQALVTRISELRAEALRRSAEFYRPTMAAPGAPGSARPGTLGEPSAADPPRSSGSGTSSPDSGSTP